MRRALGRRDGGASKTIAYLLFTTSLLDVLALAFTMALCHSQTGALWNTFPVLFQL